MKARIVMFLGVAGMAMVLFAVACSGGKTDPAPVVNPSPTLDTTAPPTDEPTPTATAEPIEEPTSIVVPSPTTPAVPPPSANPVPGSCLVLEEQYCGLGERVSWQTPWGDAMDVVGFRLPVGAVVFSPFDDLVSSGDSPSGNFMNPDAATVTVYSGSDLTAPMFQAVGDFTLEPAARQPNTARGAPLARVQDSGIRVFGDYNLIVALARPNASGTFTAAEDLIAQLFPHLAP